MNSRICRGYLKARTALMLVILGTVLPLGAGQNEERWWPVQVMPQAVVRTVNQQEFPEPRSLSK